jgi:hypothetical protein
MTYFAVRASPRLSGDSESHGFSSSSSQIRCPRTAGMLRWQRDLHGVGEIALRMAVGYRVRSCCSVTRGCLRRLTLRWALQIQPHQHNEDELLRSVASKLPDQLVEIIRSFRGWFSARTVFALLGQHAQPSNWPCSFPCKMSFSFPLHLPMTTRTNGLSETCYSLFLSLK